MSTAAAARLHPPPDHDNDPDDVPALRACLAAALARVAELEAENARLRRRGRRPDPHRLKLGEKIHAALFQGKSWLDASRAVHRAKRTAQKIYSDWLRARAGFQIDAVADAADAVAAVTMETDRPQRPAA